MRSDSESRCRSQAGKMAAISDGAIVGSAIVKLIEKYGKESPKYVGEYVKAMKKEPLVKPEIPVISIRTAEYCCPFFILS